jgi:hypothetical protein
MLLIESGRDTRYVMDKYHISRSTIDRNWKQWKQRNQNYKRVNMKPIQIGTITLAKRDSGVCYEAYELGGVQAIRFSPRRSDTTASVRRMWF